MTSRNFLAALVGASLVGAPVIAQAAPTEIESARTGSEIEAENLRGGFLLPLIAIVAIIAAVLLLDDDDAPESP